MTDPGSTAGTAKSLFFYVRYYTQVLASSTIKDRWREKINFGVEEIKPHITH